MVAQRRTQHINVPKKTRGQNMPKHGPPKCTQSTKSPLSASDWENLAASGLKRKSALDNGIHTESDPAVIQNLLKWNSSCSQLGSCLVFPYRDLTGRDDGFARVRPSFPRTTSGKTAKYEQPRSVSLRAYFPVGCLDGLNTCGVPVIITEGEKKAIALNQVGYVAIGLAGVNAWGRNGKMIDDLAAIDWQGRPVHIAFDYDAKPRTKSLVRRAANGLASALTAQGAEVHFIDLPPSENGGKQGVDDYLLEHGRRAFSRLVTSARRSHGIRVDRVDTISPEQTTWCWSGRIPSGAMTLLDGDPGLGKSTIACDLAARLSKGDCMPDEIGRRRCEPKNVVMLSAEDDPNRTIRPRLEAAGAKLDRVFLLGTAHDIDGDRPMSLPRDIDILEEKVRDLHAHLVIIDPLMAFIDAAVDTNSDAKTRRVLHRLSELARNTGAAVLLLRHLNKNAGNSAIYRGGGSIAFTAACRSCLAVGPDPADSTKCILASVKCNLAPRPKAIAYQVGAVSLPTGNFGRIIWGPESELTAEDIIGGTPRLGQSHTVDCVAAIREILASQGPLKSEELSQLVIDRTGVSRRTIASARTQAGVMSRKEPGQNGKWWCKLKEQEFSWEIQNREDAARMAEQIPALLARLKK